MLVITLCYRWCYQHSLIHSFTVAIFFSLFVIARICVPECLLYPSVSLTLAQKNKKKTRKHLEISEPLRKKNQLSIVATLPSGPLSCQFVIKLRDDTVLVAVKQSSLPSLSLSLRPQTRPQTTATKCHSTIVNCIIMLHFQTVDHGYYGFRRGVYVLKLYDDRDSN